jgi:hypothetical protein
MGDAPHTGSPLKHLRAARAMATFATAYASQMDQEFMTKIKRAGITQRDVKNEGTSGDVYENKGTEKMKNGISGDVDENTRVNR